MNRRTWWWLALAIAALALAASWNSVFNGFAYDDVYLIARNSRRMGTLAGFWREFAHTYWPEESGGDGYRPLTIILFRLESVIGGGRPMVFHAVNVAIHVTTSVVLFWAACAILPLAAAWVAASLYAVHPVHVEAIANVVGQSELWVALFFVAAVGVYLHGRAAGPLTPRRWLAVAALYGVACLFKENAIVLPAVLLLAEATVVRDKLPVLRRLAQLRVPIALVGLVGLCYLWARSRVVIGGGSGFQPYIVFQALNLSTANRVLTMVGASPEWLRLFLWPARLATEYAPPYIDMAQGPSLTQLPGLLMLIGVLGLFLACWRRGPATSFGIGWLIITLLPASNFLIPAGFIIAERTLLLPSVGVMLAIGSAVPWLYARFETVRVAQIAGAGAVAVLLALGVARSATRNPVWQSNETLFRQQVKDSPNSYRAHFMLGQHLFENERKVEGDKYYRRAMQLFPLDPIMVLGLAEQYRKAGMCEPAITLYRWLFYIAPQSNRGHGGFAGCLLVTLHLDEAKQEALRSIRAGGSVREARAIIQAADEASDSLAARHVRGDSVPRLPVAP